MELTTRLYTHIYWANDTICLVSIIGNLGYGHVLLKCYFSFQYRLQLLLAHCCLDTTLLIQWINECYFIFKLCSVQKMYTLLYKNGIWRDIIGSMTMKWFGIKIQKKVMSSVWPVLYLNNNNLSNSSSFIISVDCKSPGKLFLIWAKLLLSLNLYAYRWRPV